MLEATDLVHDPMDDHDDPMDDPMAEASALTNDALSKHQPLQLASRSH